MTQASKAAPPPRPDLDVEIDRARHQARFATDPGVSASYWRRHNELVEQRAARAAAATPAGAGA